MRTWPALDVGPLAHPDLFQAALLDYGVAAVDETTQSDAWRVFFSSDADRDAAADGLARQFPGTIIRPLNLPDEDWVARSQASLRAVTIGGTIVAPPWDVPDATHATRPLVIVIRPSMGFGTGHHATTRLCLLALQQIDLHGRRVLDVGTGSGLLAIAASRFGAAQVVAIDDDPDACRAAEENVTLNPGAAVIVRRCDVRAMTPEPFDVVLANLTGALLRNAAPRMRDLTAPGARLVLSGFMQTEEADVLDAYSSFSATARSEEDEWLCVTLRRS